ncbi:Myc-type basic helix-loop-helix (bHLH) domain-containing protein [Dioscorea alata]|uniref:Myc-type basic helix-loop-helix (BHLH) domain-containing protein n=1 Tax=Dioscorea alata TaxID=55571 RepID=A0ACB7UYY7_DIOAL|nr:Myc-type basic helix-loop-helix (bHLH) domain-containing protein [Dioscorea alata]
MDPFSFQDEIMQLEDIYFPIFSPDPFALIQLAAETEIQSTASVLPSEKEREECIAPCFVEYSRVRDEHVRRKLELKSNEQRNVHQRVIEYLRKIPKTNNPKMEMRVEGNSSRLFRHMMKERLRREKISQCYADLYSIILPRPKADKNSIVQSAAVYLKELQICKEELRRQNKMLREKIDTGNILRSKGIDSRTEYEMKDDNMSIEETKIEVQLMNPVSTIDSMIEALQCMKGMGVKAMSIHSEFYGDEFTTMMTINTKVEKSEVGRAVEGTPVEMERKMRLQLQRRGVWAPTRQQQQQPQVYVEN